MKLLFCLTLVCLAALVVPARAYRMDEPFSLGRLDLQASLIVKATALESVSLRDDDAKTLGSGPYLWKATRFRVVSVLKGQKQVEAGREIEFRHYAVASNFRGAWNYTLRHYNFAAGSTYLLWANRDGDYWLPFSSYDSVFSQQGALLAPDDAPVAGAIRDVVWNQIQGLLASETTGGVITGMRYLGRMRRRDAGTSETTGDFSNDEVARALRPLINSTDADIAVYAMRVAQFDASRFASELMIASHSLEPRVRAAALDALGGVSTPESEARIRLAVNEVSPIVAAAALRSLAAFPDDATRATWRRWAQSDDPARRIAVAQGIARSRDQEMSPVLQSLTHDADKEVSYAASLASRMYGDKTTRIFQGF